MSERLNNTPTQRAINGALTDCEAPLTRLGQVLVEQGFPLRAQTVIKLREWVIDQCRRACEGDDES